ncbi:unnamed protein product [Protopolystoma xenopodis]|uniref:Uncharacterized protein n=1 Tax=Protopolystoma xenopodis TaxID=117903 RepID=A0A3S4ZTE3_9PLAT|nr:unnamed protein product [Protopolystoma xenopodis]
MPTLCATRRLRPSRSLPANPSTCYMIHENITFRLPSPVGPFDRHCHRSRGTRRRVDPTRKVAIRDVASVGRGWRAIVLMLASAVKWRTEEARGSRSVGVEDNQETLDVHSKKGELRERAIRCVFSRSGPSLKFYAITLVPPRLYSTPHTSGQLYFPPPYFQAGQRLFYRLDNLDGLATP